MTFSRVWGAGLADNNPATGAALTQLDINVSRALDGFAGGKSSPSAKLVISGAGAQISDVNEAASFSTKYAKWVAAAFDCPGRAAMPWGAVVDISASLDVPGNLFAVSTAGNDDLGTSQDDGISWSSLAPSTGSVFRCVACAPAPSGNGHLIAGTVSNTVYWSDDEGGTHHNATAPGTPTAINVAHYDPTNGRYVIIGKTAGAPYIATATIASPPVFTQRTVPASITGSNDGISIAQNLVTGRLVASWAGQTKVAFSDDGATWTASTTSLVSGDYVIRWGNGVFIAIRKAGTNIYISTDGNTWSTSGIVYPTISAGTASSVGSFASLNGIFAIVTANLTILFTVDNGATWARSKIGGPINLIKAAGFRIHTMISGVPDQHYRSRKLGMIAGE